MCSRENILFVFCKINYLVFLYIRKNIVNSCAGIPIKKSIHNDFGGEAKATKRVRKVASKVDQITSEIAIVLTQGFFQTAVNISKIINVIGIA